MFTNALQWAQPQKHLQGTPCSGLLSTPHPNVLGSPGHTYGSNSQRGPWLLFFSVQLFLGISLKFHKQDYDELPPKH